MELDFEIIKPYLTWSLIVIATFVGTVFITTDVSRRILQIKINKVFPINSGPLTEEQIKLVLKKASYDVKVLKKDLNEWKALKNERKLTQCKALINMIEEIKYLTRYKLLTNEQIREINNYMVTYKPVWEKTEVSKHNKAA